MAGDKIKRMETEVHLLYLLKFQVEWKNILKLQEKNREKKKTFLTCTSNYVDIFTFGGQRQQLTFVDDKMWF